jgi:hypothetical protein
MTTLHAALPRLGCDRKRFCSRARAGPHRRTVKHLAAAAAVLSLLIAGGCGDGDGSITEARPQSINESPTASPTRTAPVLTDEQLYSALARPEDLPPSYVETEPSEDSEGNSQGATPECTERLKVLADLEDGVDELAEAEREYESEQEYASLTHTWYAYESQEQVKLEFDEIAAAFRDCPALVVEGPSDQPVELAITAVDVPDLGDGAAGYLASADVEGVPIQMAMHLSYVGRYAQFVGQVGLGVADGALVLEVAALGMERLPQP